MVSYFTTLSTQEARDTCASPININIGSVGSSKCAVTSQTSQDMSTVTYTFEWEKKHLIVENKVTQQREIMTYEGISKSQSSLQMP